MTAPLTRRKYLLAARLANDTARTFGLWLTAGFVVLLIASFVYRAATDEYAQFAEWPILVIPMVMTGAGWVHLHKGYPLAIANGLTRREFATAFALYGAASVLAAAALTQLGKFVIDQFATFRGVEHGTAFYGAGWLDSVSRPALWFAVGAAAGAAMLRLGGRWLGALVSALFVAAVVYRPVAISFGINLAEDASASDGTIVQVPVAMDSTSLAWIDLALTAVFALAALALLARAPMRPKPA